jgi:hypothetical protein
VTYDQDEKLKTHRRETRMQNWRIHRLGTIIVYTPNN